MMQVNRARLCAHRGEGEAEEEGNNRSSVADREVCVYTSSNTNRRCRLDKEIKGKGATQINQDQCTNGLMHLSCSLKTLSRCLKNRRERWKSRESSRSTSFRSSGSAAERHSLDFLIRIGCRTEHKPSNLKRNSSSFTEVTGFWHTSRTTVDFLDRIIKASRLVIFRSEGQTLHPRQLQVTVLREHPEVVQRLWFGCVSYALLWSTSEAEHPQTFGCTHTESQGFADGTVRRSDEEEHEDERENALIWFEPWFYLTWGRSVTFSQPQKGNYNLGCQVNALEHLIHGQLWKTNEGVGSNQG